MFPFFYLRRHLLLARLTANVISTRRDCQRAPFCFFALFSIVVETAEQLNLGRRLDDTLPTGLSRLVSLLLLVRLVSGSQDLDSSSDADEGFLLLDDGKWADDLFDDGSVERVVAVGSGGVECRTVGDVGEFQFATGDNVDVLGVENVLFVLSHLFFL